MKLRAIYIGMVAVLLTACTAVTDGDTDVTEPEVNKHFINLSIVVSNNNGAATRGTPAGGENGDGREAGFERENAITGITLILYQDATGINTTSDPVIDFVAYYYVSRSGDPATAGTSYTEKTAEATYQTGNQLVPPNAIDFTKTYHAIVVANTDLTSSIIAGTSSLNDLRNMTLNKIYSGDETRTAASCGNFVMSSEQNQTLTFSGHGTQDATGDYYYDLTTQPLVIERMAARIDFWAVNGTYNSDKAGYVYNVEGCDDKFVVTAIMPFNLTHKHATYGNEYLLKRLTTSLSTITPQWLINETTTNYVLDPMTVNKSAEPLLTNSRESVKGLTTHEAFAANSYYKSITDMHSAVTSGSTSGYSTLTDLTMTGEDVIVAYPMENTLLPQSKLYYYATGIAIEGYYYVNGLTDPNPQRYVYYGYLRHQGEGESYDILTTNETTEVSSATPMNFGIVRNNIYRVWIGSIDTKLNMQLRIVVKKWDPFTHETIYM